MFFWIIAPGNPAAAPRRQAMAGYRLHRQAHLGFTRRGALAVSPAPEVHRGNQPEQRPQVPEVQNLVEHPGDEHADYGSAEQLGPGEDAGVTGPQTPGCDPPAPGENDDEQADERQRAERATLD